jgi:hypothetical protein
MYRPFAWQGSGDPMLERFGGFAARAVHPAAKRRSAPHLPFDAILPFMMVTARDITSGPVRHI